MDEYIYFDHAATSYPKAPAVHRAIRHCLTVCGGNPGRSGHPLAVAAEEVLYNGRCAVAELLQLGKPENVVFTQSATYALNFAIRAFGKKGGHVLISSMEHNAVVRPVASLAREGLWHYSVFRFDDVGDFLRRLTPQTSLVVITVASNVSGDLLPVNIIGKICRERRISLVLDASQGAGHFPITFQNTGADAICAPGHKALGGIQGVGFLALREGTEESLPEMLQGGSGSQSRLLSMPAAFPERWEAGTPPTPAVAALTAGIRRLQRKTDDPISELADRVREMLASLPGVTLYGKGSSPCSIVPFSLSKMPSEAVAAALGAEGICVRAGLHCAPLAHKSLQTPEDGCVRLSFGYGNSKHQAEKFYRVMKGLCP